LDTLHNLGKDDKIENERRGQQRVLASVVHSNGVLTIHEDLGSVFVKSSLAITDVGHIFNDNDVIRVFVGFVEDRVGGNHVIDDAALRDFLGTELLGLGQVLTIVVTKVIIGDDGLRLNTGLDEEIDKDGFDLGLARLEVIATNENSLLLGKVDETRNEGVLRRAVDVSAAFKDGGDGKQSGGRDL